MEVFILLKDKDLKFLLGFVQILSVSVSISVSVSCSANEPLGRRQIFYKPISSLHTLLQIVGSGKLIYFPMIVQIYL